MEAEHTELKYWSDLTLIPKELRPPNFTSVPRMDRLTVTQGIKEEQYILIQRLIVEYRRLQAPFNNTEREVLERLQQLVANELNHADISTVKTISGIFYPRSLFARTVCPVFGTEDTYTVKCVWDSKFYSYLFHLTQIWNIFSCCFWSERSRN
jgi:hypothetical protein